MESLLYLWNPTAAVGAVVLVYWLVLLLLHIWSFCRAFLLAPIGIGQTNLLQYGKWAVVTGASEGIGRAYSLELARKGLNVVLMSRSEEKLSKVAKEIEENYGCKCRIISVDFSSQGMDIYSTISEEIRDLNIAILVNNVGIATEYPDYFTNLSAKRMYSVVQINCQAVSQMTRLVLPGMLARGGGVIVNMSSATSLNPLPQSVVYSATKMFINYFSEGLRKEYKTKGIIVQNVRPFFVATPGTGLAQSTCLIANATEYVKSLVATIGIQDNTFGSISHHIQGSFSSLVPGCISDLVVEHTSNSLRQRWFSVRGRETTKNS